MPTKIVSPNVCPDCGSDSPEYTWRTGRYVYKVTETPRFWGLVKKIKREAIGFIIKEDKDNNESV
jgi:hypothetical protein